jgi:hypothetical protein
MEKMEGQGGASRRDSAKCWVGSRTAKPIRRSLRFCRPVHVRFQPDIEATINGNRVEISWGWNGNSAFLDLCEIEVDRNDNKGSILLTYDSTPNYVDTAPFPATPTKWIYRAIYRVGDQRVGQWSKPVTVTVGG